MSDVFESYSQQFSNISVSLQQRFRRSYRANEDECIKGYKDLQEAEKCIKTMDLELFQLQGQDQLNAKQKLKQYKIELSELKERFKAYQNIIEYNKKKGIIPIDEREQRLIKAEQQISQQNFQLIEIKRSAYEADNVAINIQKELNKNNEVLDKALNRVKDTNSGMDDAEKLVREMQRRIMMNKCIIWGVIGAVIIAFMQGGAIKQIPDGARTKTIYNLIKDQKYPEAISYLNYELQFCPKSRALSLLAYCYFMSQDFANAAKIYEQLVRFYPEVDDYKIYYAQTLFKDGLYDESLRACQNIENSQYQDKLILLQALIRYEKNEIQHAKTLLRQASQDDPDIIVNEGCILFKEQKYEEARVKFQEAMNQLGYNCELAYNIALCHYKMKQLAPSLKNIAEIIEKGVREHPELGVGSNAEGIEVKSVGNTQALKETALIEAFNLKAAIEYSIKNIPAAKEALLDMPPRGEEELDPVTLMNQALMNIEDDPSGGFKKLNHLLQNPPSPPETFPNLLLLYCKYQYYDLAADVLAENADLTFTINQEDFDYIDALILSNASPEEAYNRFEKLSNNHIDTLRKITKNIQDSRLARDNEGIKKSLKEFDECLEKYIPVLMAQAKIFWDRENYQQVEKLFRQSAEFCADHEAWKLNVAHVFYVQDNKFREAIRYYEPIVKKYGENLCSLTAIVIANLCVSYIMVNQNEEAEELMKKLEREEEKAAFQDPEKPVYHLCIVNLVIGTLYCAKGNYEFGISRIVKSLEPYNKKINTDTWFYAKRCFCSLIETMSKHMIILKDTSINEFLDFLDAADQYGKNIPTEINVLDKIDEKCTVSYEARLLKRMFFLLRG